MTQQIRHRTDPGRLADRDAMLAEAEQLLTRAGDAPLEGADRARFDELTASLDAWAAREAQCHEIARLASLPGHTEPAVGPLPGAPEVMRRTPDPHGPDAARGFGGPHASRDRAEACLERAGGSDQAKTTAAALIRDSRSGHIAQEWVTAVTDPAYRSAFERYLASPTTALLELDDHERRAWATATRAALTIGTPANGGFLTPYELDSTIQLVSDGATDPLRAVANVRTTSTNDLHLVTSQGVDAHWYQELAEVSDDSPTFAGPVLSCHRASVWVEASYEAAQDTDFAEQLVGLFNDSRARLEAAAHISGNGTTEPEGLVSRVAAVTASRVAAQTTSAIGAADLYSMVDSLPPRYRPNATWLAEVGTMSKIRQLDTYGGGAFWSNLGMGQPETLLGRPVYEASYMTRVAATTGDDYVMVHGDVKAAYTIADRLGSTVLYDPIVKGSNRRPVGAAGWLCMWRTGALVTDPNAVRVLKM